MNDCHHRTRWAESPYGNRPGNRPAKKRRQKRVVWWWLVVPRWNHPPRPTGLVGPNGSRLEPSFGVVGVSDGLEFSEVSTGERVKCGARVDNGVYTAFRQWVEDETGNQYAEVGRALDRAMLEYMTEDTIGKIHAQTKKNEALLRKVLDNQNSKKEKEKRQTTSVDVPQGKDPGSRREREGYVIQAVYANNPNEVTLEQLEQLITEVAGVSSDPTVSDYVQAIADTEAFQPMPGNSWRFDPDGAIEVLERRGIPIPEVAQ